mmetsp:Transcript_149928/g.462833  ORF Transcript_149928/g.462833 Transcript_149928/m.462833 type:complete len:205 (+) Transcript_149928:1944-2558(+)
MLLKGLLWHPGGAEEPCGLARAIGFLVPGKLRKPGRGGGGKTLQELCLPLDRRSRLISKESPVHVKQEVRLLEAAEPDSRELVRRELREMPDCLLLSCPGQRLFEGLVRTAQLPVSSGELGHRPLQPVLRPVLPEPQKRQLEGFIWDSRARGGGRRCGGRGGLRPQEQRIARTGQHLRRISGLHAMRGRGPDRRRAAAGNAGAS